MTRSDQQIEQLQAKLQQMLQQYCRERQMGFALSVVDPVAEGEWVQYVLVPDREGVRADDYVEAISYFERELREKQGEGTFVLVPAVAA